MQPFISQALVATRIAEMRREAEVAQLARDVRLARKHARRRGGQGLAPDAACPASRLRPYTQHRSTLGVPSRGRGIPPRLTRLWSRAPR